MPGPAGVPAPGAGEQFVFWLLAAFVLFFALLTVTRRNPVTAVMSLVATFFGLAGIYASLSAHFLAVLQVLVYAGAIMVLFIFVVMILNREEVTPVSLHWLRLAGLIGAVYLLVVFWRVSGTDVPQAPANVPDSFGTVGAIGDLLFRDFLYPFEAISLLLLVAIVGGVVVSRSHQKEVAAMRAAERRKKYHELANHDYPAQDALPPADAVAHGAGTPGAGGGGGGHH